ncbi:MAG: hypothetical protein K0M56_00200 [Kaistella sp.]|nr:hypothetical protein [Kaistella sp.]
MEVIGNVNGRQIIYINIWENINWTDNLPTHNWLVFPVGQGNDVSIYSKLADKSIDNNVLYLCAAGEFCELIHDIFDEVIIAKKIANNESIESPDDFKNSPITTWHNSFSEGLWFATTCANHEEKTIDKIICVDFMKQGVKDHLINLVESINNGWLPSDEENEDPEYDILH